MTIAGRDWETIDDPLEADAYPLVRFTGASTTRHVSESDGVITFTLALSAASTEVVTATLQASTYMSADMDTAPLVVTFAPGQTTATASFAIYNDTAYEADEVFAIDIVSATNAAVDPAVEGALNVSRLLAIIDYNDVPAGPLVSFLHTTPTGRIAESGGAFSFTLVLSEASSLPVTATVQASSYRAGDMDTSARTFTFQPGQTSISGSIAIYDDAEYEPDEIFALDLVSATNAAVNLTTQSGRAASQLLGYIDNDDAPAAHMVRFVNASGVQYFSEGGGAIPFTLQLSAPSTETVSVTVAPSSYMSADLNTAAQTIVFQPGQTTATGQVIIYDDNVFEQDEVFAIDITSATNAVIDPSVEGALQVSRILAYLQDNDPPGPPPPDVSVVGPSSVGEGDGSFQISLRFPNVGVLSGTYSYGFDEGVSTATYADVSVPSGSGSFSVAQSPSGEYIIDLGPIPIIDDALTESAETIAITLTVPGHTFSNGSSTFVHVVTLRDNDPTVGTEGPDTLVGGPGNDAIDGLGGDDSISGADGADLLVGGPGTDLIDGGPGVDTASYAAAPGTVLVDLSIVSPQNTFSAGSDSLVSVENLAGSAFNDVLTGDSGDNVLSGLAGGDLLAGGAGADILQGGDGDDVLEGGEGADLLDGGAGVDTAIYGTASSGVFVNLAYGAPHNSVGAGDEILISVENLTGSAFDDVLTGDAGDNVLRGEAGNDTLIGGAGDDTLIGGEGARDRVQYFSAAGGVTVNLGLSGRQTIGGGEGADLLSGIEHVIGSQYADTLIGNDLDNAFTGFDGDDVIEGGAGDDSLDGGPGSDTASYRSAASAVTVSIWTDYPRAGGTRDTVGAGVDNLHSIENLTGSAFDDTLTGDHYVNVLDGGAGSDTLFGLSGDDVLRDGGETSNRDFLYGGAGNDTYYVTSSLTGPTDLVYEGAAVARAEAGVGDVDVIRSGGEFFWDFYGVGEELYVEGVTGSQIVGGTNSQSFFGNAGNDVMLVYGGSNRVDAGAGVDAIALGLYGLDESFDGANTIVMKAGSGMDYVYDFESGVDKIDLTSFNFGITGAQVLAQAVNVDLAGTANDHVYFYLTSAGGVDNFIVFMGLLSSQLQAGDFLT